MIMMLMIFVNLGYQNKWAIDLYVEHNGYDVLDIRDQSETMVHDEGNESSDAYSSDDEELGFVDFHTESNDNVVIKTLTTNDHFLNKLCSNNGHFRGFIDELVNENVERVVEDTKSIDPEFNVKSKAKNGEGTSKSPQANTKSPQTTTNSPQTTGKSGEGCSVSPKWTKSRVASHRGVLKEHYVRLWEYRQAILDSNPGSTCRLDEEETSYEDEILKQVDREYMEELLFQEEEKREAEHKAQREVYDEEALRLSFEEHASYAREDEERLR
ncbi:hypothetical protein Tco_0365470 [Tanacetum coccineum]